MTYLPFQDRADAGRLLGAQLALHKLLANPIVLALPRGGVPVGAEVAEALNAPLDVVVVRKIGVPWQPELAMGAIAGGTRVLDHQLIREFRISEKQVEAIVAAEVRELARREQLYRSGAAEPDVRDLAVILVDDGLATGSTMLVAARHVRTLNPRALIIAVPVGSLQALSRVRTEADDCICLATPDPFMAVGEWYEDFREVSDAKVRELLQAARTRLSRS